MNWCWKYDMLSTWMGCVGRTQRNELRSTKSKVMSCAQTSGHNPLWYFLHYQHQPNTQTDNRIAIIVNVHSDPLDQSDDALLKIAK